MLLFPERRDTSIISDSTAPGRVPLKDGPRFASPAPNIQAFPRQKNLNKNVHRLLLSSAPKVLSRPVPVSGLKHSCAGEVRGSKKFPVGEGSGGLGIDERTTSCSDGVDLAIGPKLDDLAP